jgi:putative sterol carrier protein
MAKPPGSVGEALEWLSKGFRPDACRNVSVTYQIDLSGEHGGRLWLRIDHGRLQAVEGSALGPDVTFRLEATDFFAILAGRENPDLLFMAERLVVQGDLSLALKLRSYFGSA